MAHKILLAAILAITLSGLSDAQVKQRFSGDIDKFREELKTYLGPNLNPEQSSIVNSFLVKWDSSGFSRDNMTKIADITGKLASRNMRTSPHLLDFLKSLTDFTGYAGTRDYMNNWLTGLTKSALNESITNDNLDRYFRNTSAFIKNNLIFDSNTSKWKIEGGTVSFRYDTIFKMIVKDVTLIAKSGKDSTAIFRVSGVYYPEVAEFRGSSGIVYWEKAGYPKEDVFAEIIEYRINTTRTNFTADSARLTHKTYFREPVYGKLTDQATFYNSPEKAQYPKFETKAKKFVLKEIYKGVNYEGGLALDGASVRGTGDNYFPAKITLFRNDTLYVKVVSSNFLLTKSGINSQETSASLYLDKDSIFHSSVGFSYSANNRQVSLFRTNNPVSKSPFYDSFHNLDMYFETLYWNMNESKIILSRARGASMGQAKFESISFFSSNTYERLSGIDDYHPLYRFKQFAEYYYSPTFPVKEFAKWLKRPEDAVTGLCIEMTNKGFLFYDRNNNEVTLKKKVDDFIASNAGKKDYDVITVFSETNAPLDNASINLKNYRMTINGVPQVFLSDSQRVAIYPYNEQLVIGKNRDILFDGVVEAGLFTIFGHNFIFNYDTFKIRLQKIDSIRIAVETDKRDNYGNPIINEVDNMIQLTTAELYIDDPRNKSGLKSLQQYPIINAVTYSYIFFDKLPGLEGIYKQDNFYFRVDPFTYNNIDHYKNEEINLAGNFYGGNILQPTKQYLTVQEDNSLGFSMNIPEEGIDVYGGKGRMFNYMQLSNKGLVGSGTLKRLTSVTESEDFRFYPDSMIAKATLFNITRDEAGKYPYLRSTDVSVKWLSVNDEWIARNSKDKYFDMFDNGTVLDGSLTLTPSSLRGSGIINSSDSRITSDNFTFNSDVIRADTSDYNLKSLRGDGYAFIAENVNSAIDFRAQQSRFSLNTDISVVKFPEIEYICTMTDFTYDMKSRILSMEQKGKASSTLIPADQLVKISFAKLDKPTFFSTNNLKDTISFTSWKGRYNLQQESVEADNINYIHIADALIQPDSGKLVIGKRAIIKPLKNATVAVNNRHILHSANITIENSKRYSGSAVYNYLSENKEIQQISLPEITVDTATTIAKGFIAASQKFTLSPAFTFTGDVMLSAREDFLTFTGAAGIVHNCSNLRSFNVKFKSQVNPNLVMIPYGDKPRDFNDNLVFSGSFVNIDSAHVYPAFLSERKSWSDAQIVSPVGLLYFEKQSGRYIIASKEKLADPTLSGNQVAFDKNYCVLSGEGKLNFGANFDLLKMASAGKTIHETDSNRLSIEGILALDFHFSPEAFKLISDELRMIPTLTAVNLNTDIYKKGMKDLIGTAAANQINEEMGLYGTSRNLPKEYTYELLLNDIKMYWNQPTASFRSKGKIGIGFIGPQAINVYVDGYIEIQRRRSGDMIDIYLKANESVWYYFSYFRGVMMSQAGNIAYNSLLTSIKEKERKDPQSTIRVPYMYMVAVEDRLRRFIQRMESDNLEEGQQR
jgi:hypothetical protein